MDEVVGHELAEFVDGTHVQNIENEFPLKPGSSNMLQSDEMVTSGVDVYPENSKIGYSEILDGKNLDRIGSSGHASASPRCADDGGTVEELTLRNYSGEKLTVVGSPNSRDKVQTRRNQWQHLYQIAGGSGIGHVHGHIGYKERGQANSSSWEEGGNNLFSGLLLQNQPQPNYSHDAVANNLLDNNDKGNLGDMLYSYGGIRSKILSKSGFSEYFIKSTLRGKGAVHKSLPRRGSSTEAGDSDHPNSNIDGLTKSAAPLVLMGKHVPPMSHGLSEPRNSLSSTRIGDGISLREWLEAGRNKTNKVESLRIFRQVLDFVNFSHSNGVSLQDLRPSCFKLLRNRIVYLGSSVRAGLTDNVKEQDCHQSSHNQNDKRPIHQTMLTLESNSVKKRYLGENNKLTRRWPQFPARSGANVNSMSRLGPGNDVDEEQNLNREIKNQTKFFGHSATNSLQPLEPSVGSTLEKNWYASPELFNEKSCSFASNIYCLGVLLFELLGSFDSGRSHAAAMQDLRHRILPPSFLSENPKEAGFCLWLLHPEASSRPTTREILQSELMSGIQQLSEGELLPSMEEEDGESELLLYFLLSLNEQKQKDASSLLEQIQRIEADIQEVEKRRPQNSLVLASSSHESFMACRNNYTHGENPSLDVLSKMSPVTIKGTRLMRNIKQLESAYFSLGSNISDRNAATRRDDELLKNRGTCCSMGKEEKFGATDTVGSFFDGFCKYARYNKFKVRGVLRSAEFNNSANVICSLSFDRDEDYLAAGGVSKKIKIYEFQALFNDSVDIHYPAVEMANKSKLSCICWNSYIRNYLASTDYDGIVKLWDAATGQGVSDFIEHSARAWSVDFSPVDPMKLATGSDDRLVKLWSINDKNSLCTIRNNANVCSVQFSPSSSHLLAFTSADYRTYCYDLRNVSIPWCTLAGHEKAVSYAKFLDAGTLVSASTDNTLKIWDLSKTSSNSLSRDACILTLSGHTNEKNFVGLSVADGYITCGSETNEVFAYYRSLPMPVATQKFGSIDTVTGKETEDDNGQFVSSVCWRRKSNMVVAANSSGCIKLLQMV